MRSLYRPFRSFAVLIAIAAMLIVPIRPSFVKAASLNPNQQLAVRTTGLIDPHITYLYVNGINQNGTATVWRNSWENDYRTGPSAYAIRNWWWSDYYNLGVRVKVAWQNPNNRYIYFTSDVFCPILVGRPLPSDWLTLRIDFSNTTASSATCSWTTEVPWY